jgi:hypothetical protein
MATGMNQSEDKKQPLVGTHCHQQGSVYLPISMTKLQMNAIKEYAAFNMELLELCAKNKIFHQVPLMEDKDNVALICVAGNNLWLVEHILTFLVAKKLLSSAEYAARLSEAQLREQDESNRQTLEFLYRCASSQKLRRDQEGNVFAFDGDTKKWKLVSNLNTWIHTQLQSGLYGLEKRVKPCVRSMDFIETSLKNKQDERFKLLEEQEKA